MVMTKQLIIGLQLNTNSDDDADDANYNIITMILMLTATSH